MYYYRCSSACFCLLFLALASPVSGQQGEPGPPPLRRWLDVQSVHAAIRYRWTETDTGRVTTSGVQWQTQLRARFLFDSQARYHLGTFVTTGTSFRSGWVNTGIGLGREAHPTQVRQLYFGAQPVAGLELQIGGLAVNRGELTDVIASDNDSFFVGERLTVRPSRGRVTQLSAAVGHFDAAGEPDFFKQADDMDAFNYGQALVGFRVSRNVTGSVDYTYENGRDILREGLVIRLPSSVKLLTQLRLESYQRVAPDHKAGFNVSTDFRVRKLAGAFGIMSADRDYGPFNGDRYESGQRYYHVVNYALTPELQLQWFHTHAFDIEFPIPLKQRLDVVLTYNPTAALKRARIF